MVAEEKGDDEERAGEDPETKPPAREIPLTREHLKPLQAAIRDVRRLLPPFCHANSVPRISLLTCI